MSHTWQPDGKLWARLLEIDTLWASEIQMAGCACGGRLHRADYPRKPRGNLGEHEEAYVRRFSFCCAVEGCRRRATPPSVRFLGRRVYVGAVVITESVRLLTGLSDALGVPLRTVSRWLAFWRTQLTAMTFWDAVRGLFMPPVEADKLPSSLLERLGGHDRDGVTRLLCLLSPITTGFASKAMAVS